MKHVLAALLTLSALPAIADEVWSTPAGEIVFETTLDNGMSVFSAPAQLMMDAPDDARLWIYIPDFVYVENARSFHEAFWLVEGMAECPMGLTAPDGRKSMAWGRAQLAFDAPTFPTGFALIMGVCAYDPITAFRADPVLGD